MKCEIDRNAPLMWREKLGGFLALISPLIGIALVSVLCGCKSFYENSGSAVRVGTMNAPIEVSDGSDSFACKLLYSMDGAYAYTRKDSKVTVIYDNIYTNTYIGCIEKRGNQHLQVDVEPLYVGDDPATNTTSSVTNAVEAAAK